MIADLKEMIITKYVHDIGDLLDWKEAIDNVLLSFKCILLDCHQTHCNCFI